MAEFQYELLGVKKTRTPKLGTPHSRKEIEYYFKLRLQLRADLKGFVFSRWRWNGLVTLISLGVAVRTGMSQQWFRSK